MTVGLQRSGDWPAARHIGRGAATPANHRCAVGRLPLSREECRLLKLILHSDLRRRAASRRAHVTPSQFPTLNFKPNFKFSRLNFFGGPHPSFICGLKFTVFFRPTWEGLSLINCFSDFRLWIHFGDIRDQSRKLSEMATNFGRFFCTPKF